MIQVSGFVVQDFCLALSAVYLNFLSSYHSSVSFFRISQTTSYLNRYFHRHHRSV